MTLLVPSGDRGIGSWPERRARMDPTRTALVQDERSLTWTHLADRVRRLAGGLAGLGVGRSDRVAFLGTNDIATFEVLFAASRLGAITVALNTRLAAEEIAYMLADCGASVLVVGRGVDALASAVLARPDRAATSMVRHVVAQDPRPEALDLEALTVGSEPLAGEIDVDLAEPAIILYTSGTTGRPKGAVLTHGNLTWNTVNQLAHTDVLHDDRALCFSPLFHVVGLGQITLPTLLKGGSVEVLARFDAATVLARVEAHAITGFSCVPTMLQLMAEHPSFATTDLGSLRHICYGGSPVAARVAQAWLDRGVQLLQGYGMTEAAPGVLMALAEGAAEHPVSVGVPHFFTDVRSGEADELLIRGPHVFDGYWERPDESAASVVDGRWFRTGDVVRTDEDGWSHVVDRIKDMIISGGENIYPAEVEAVITALEGVRAAAVVGTPDERWGEVGIAYVELAPDAAVTAADLRSHLEQHLARYKIPRTFHLVEALPRNATGKVRRVDLRARGRAETPAAVPPDTQETR